MQHDTATYRSKEHVANAVAASKDKKGDSDVDGGGASLPEMRLEHGFQHAVAAQGAEEIDKGEEQGRGADYRSKPEILICIDRLLNIIAGSLGTALIHLAKDLKT